MKISLKKMTMLIGLSVVGGQVYSATTKGVPVPTSTAAKCVSKCVSACSEVTCSGVASTSNALPPVCYSCSNISTVNSCANACGSCVNTQNVMVTSDEIEVNYTKLNQC